eukprot:364870-Chlamydomonas_euryale.AAC.21
MAAQEPLPHSMLQQLGLGSALDHLPGWGVLFYLVRLCGNVWKRACSSTWCAWGESVETCVLLRGEGRVWQSSRQRLHAGRADICIRFQALASVANLLTC